MNKGEVSDFAAYLKSHSFVSMYSKFNYYKLIPTSERPGGGF